jgi:amino acid adenylation domain-containing protein/non-ribosomal peptide synthase protein (TIGR01720 family)
MKAITQPSELSAYSPVPQQSSAEAYTAPLSFAQQRLWFLYKLEPDSPAYNLAAAVHLAGALNESALRRSLEHILQRHEALRTTFAEVDGQPMQIIGPSAEVVLPVHDLQGLEDGEKSTVVREIASEEARNPFDLLCGPLLRTRLLKLGPVEHLFVVAMHHIVSDGWSIGVFIRELAQLYNAVCKAECCTLPPLAMQYSEFAHLQRQRMQGETLAQHLAYWRSQLEGAPSVVELPADHPRPAVQSFRGALESFSLPRRLTAKLNSMSRSEGCTLFMTLLAAFKVLLCRYTGQTDLLVGTPVANRNCVETEGLIGVFVNTLVLRSDLSGNPTFREFLGQVRGMSLDAFAHQDLPFEKLMDELQPSRNLSHAPLFQVMFALQNTPVEKLALDGLRAEIVELDNGTSKFDLSLSVEDTAQGLSGTFEYNSDLFAATTIRRMAGHFETLLQAIVADPDQPVWNLPLLTRAEQQQLLVEFNDTTSQYFPELCVHQRFESQAEQVPEAIAARYKTQELTFAELNKRANRLAHYLRGRGVGPNVLVGICAERSLEMLIGMLAVLKAGGAYVPMDASYPGERLSFMLKDTRARVLLTQEKLRSRFTISNTEIVCLDGEFHQWLHSQKLPEDNPAGGASLDSLAYVIYTSGSTGHPKGILIPHRGLANYLAWCTSAYNVEAGKGAPVHTSISFDLTITALFAPLVAGRPVDLLPEGPGIESLCAALGHGRNYSLVKITPLHLQLLRHEISRAQAAGLTRTFVIGGENLLADDLSFWREAAPETVLVNEYGPTETVVGCCVYRQPIRGRTTGSVPIGRPIANTVLYVLDRNLEPVPIGVPGELFVGGLGLAWGYLNRPELTAEKFIPNPFATQPGARLYRTGDLVRHLPDGNLEYLGRIDHQVKIRGYRIELGEIETVLREHPGVREAVVITREDTPGEKRVVAYVAPHYSADLLKDELDGYLKERLPQYMLPVLVLLDSLPSTSNGKVDHSRLPIPTGAVRPDRGGNLVAPRSLEEMLLAKIWAEVLHVDQVGVSDNFFELGGDSILTIHVIAKCSQAGMHLTPRQLFQNQTIAELAKVITTASQIEAPQHPVTGPVPLTPVQHWFFEQKLLQPHHWNQSVLLEVDSSLSASHIERALRHLVVHHDALRSRFEGSDVGWCQTVAAPGEPVPLARVDVSHLSETERASAIAVATAESQIALNLADGPILRATFFDFGSGNTSRLLIIVHHLVVDAVSWRILLEDMEALCRQLNEGGTLYLPAKTSSFKHWAERLTEYAASDPVREETVYWLETARLPVASLPVDYPDGANTEASLESISVALSSDETRALLHDVPKVLHVQMNDVLLGAVAVAFRQWVGTRSLLLDIEGHGREALFEDIDLSRTVGWFTTICPMRLDLSAVGDPAETVQAIARQRQQVRNGGIGYGVARYLSNDPQIFGALARLAQPEVLFNYLGQFDGVLSGSHLLRPMATGNGTDRSVAGNRTHLLEISAHVSGGALTVEWSYSGNVHADSTIAGVVRDFAENLRAVIRHCQPGRALQPCVSDFALANLAESQLSAIVAKTCEGAGQVSLLEEIEDIYPLSSTQQGLFFHGLRTPESGAYFEQLTATLDGKLDVDAFEQAWQWIAQHQPVLRTAFVWEESLNEPLQVVRRYARLQVGQHDWTGLSDDRRREQLERFLQQDRKRGFTLSKAPLARIALIQLTDQTRQFVFSFHHLLLDGWSVPLLFKEFFAVYEALRCGKPPDQQPVRPYRDYIAWLRDQNPEKLEAYWRKTLKGLTSPTRLLSRGSQSAPTVNYGRQIVRLNETTTAELQSLARRNHLTLNTLLLGAWSLILGKYSQSDDVMCGVTTSGRPAGLAGVENMLGLFINTLPVRFKLDWQADMLTWCRQLQEEQAEWREYEYSPLVQVHGWSEIPRNQSLFESIFVFENYPVDDSLLDQTNSVTVRDVQFVDQASFPLSVLVAPGTEMLLGMGYDTHHFDEAFVAHMLADYRGLLERLIQEPLSKLSALSPRPDPALLPARGADRGLGHYSDVYKRSNLTKHQVLIWVGQKLHPDSTLYTLCVPFTIPFAIDAEHMQRAFQALVDRTDALRTVIEEIDGIPQQKVLSRRQHRMELQDFSSADNPSGAARAWIDVRRGRPFRLDAALFDTALLRVRPGEFVWYLALHHTIADGWSIKLIFDRLARLYQLSVEGRLHAADEFPQFQDYIEYERSHSDTSRWLRASAYWKEKLSYNPGPVPFYGKTSFKKTTRMRRVSYELSEELSRRLRSAVSKTSSSTIDAALFNIFASIISTWIYRTSQKRDFRLGITTHNRPSQEFKQTVGFFMQVFPIDIRIDEDDSFTSLTSKIKSELQQCLRHSQYTVENSVTAPHYDILFNYHNKDYTFQFSGVPAYHDWTHPGQGTETFAFQVRNGNHSDSFVLDCDFHCDVFSLEQQTDALQQIRRVIDAFILDPNQSVVSVPVLPQVQEHRVLVEFNRTSTPFVTDLGISELIDLQAAKTPDHVAVACQEQSLTYAQLTARATRVASRLRSMGVGPDTVVSLGMRRGVDMLTAILGVLKAGGAYLPLDLAWPLPRTSQVIGQSRSPVVLVDSEFQASLSASLEKMLGVVPSTPVCVQDLLGLDESQAMEKTRVAGGHLGYVIYTSGSTGMPKGVMVQRGGMLNHLNAKIRDLQLTDADIVAQTASHCFDISVWQFLAALLVGGQVVILDDATVHDPGRLLDAVRRNGITVLETVPSFLDAMLEQMERRETAFVDFPSLRWLISTGEALPPQLLNQWFLRFPHIPVCNAYGPTECSDDVTHHFITEQSHATANEVPIGHPVANTRLYVLDRHLQPVPIGAVGELCVAGAGVGRGYVNDPGRTAELFVPDPFAAEPGARMYRTGDLARYDSNGVLEHLGRTDDQVKIRGFRIELGEIETALASHPSLRAAAVVARQDHAGNRFLAAYIVPSRERVPDVGSLRAFLRERLPEAMVPSAFVTLSALPLTANGKVDRQALPTPELARHGLPDAFISPRDDWELRLTRIWEEILDTRPVGVRDNFFDLGGHSLLAVRLMFQLHTLSGRELPLALLFEKPTIEELAQVLREQIPVSVSSLVPIQSSGANAPLFFVHAHGGGAIAYYPLAQQLGRNQPFYGLEAPGLDGQQEPFSDIPDMASHYIAELRRVQPQGPYQLGGHSFGGLVAFEMAQQLVKHGDEVSVLAILDTAAPVDGNTPFGASDFFTTSDDTTALIEMTGLIERVIRRDLGVSRIELDSLCPEDQLRYFLKKLKQVDFVSPDAEVSLIRGFLAVHKASSRASQNYVSQAKLYPGPMILFLAHDVAPGDFRAEDRRLRDDATLGWRQLVSGTIETHMVPGDHISMLNHPNVQALALELGSCIERANRKDPSYA